MSENEVTPAAVRDVLSRHGYGFQHAVIREIRRLQQRPGAVWHDDGTEFPVEVGGASMHVDLLVRSPHGLLVCECKRVDPVFGVWCFARSALSTTYTSQSQAIIHEAIAHGDQTYNAYVVRVQPRVPHAGQYHVGFELKTSTKGEPQGTTRGALEDAITQALKGVSGITNAIAAQPRLKFDSEQLTLIPVIITTAKLVTCETDLAEADVTTGKLPDNLTLTERSWIWFRRASTPALRHQQVIRMPTEGTTFEGFNELMNALLARSIAIVSTSTPEGLESFLRDTAFNVGDS